MNKLLSGECWAGTSGLVLAEPNKAAFPPAYRSGSRLTYYASLFNSIEINSSFYKLPLPATFEKWASETGNAFRFTIKLGRDITHAKDFGFQHAGIDKFMQAANRLGDKTGALLVQLPPGLTSRKSRELAEMLNRIRISDPNSSWKLAVEFRNRSWYTDETYRLLETVNAALVLQDMPASAIMDSPVSSSFIYLRFHGPEGDYKNGYSDIFLQEQADRIRTWMTEGKDVYTYFNNTIGDAVANLRTLLHAIPSSGEIVDRLADRHA